MTPQELERIQRLEDFREICNTQGRYNYYLFMTPVVQVNKDGKTAKGMWHSFGCNTIQTEDGLIAMWQSGKYDIEFVK